MKRLVLMLISLVLTLPLHAQEQTLISGPIDNGGFGGPVVKFSQIDNRFALLVGGYGGWLINHSFMIGGGGFGLANNIRGSRAAQIYYGTGDNLRLQFGYGGFMLEYIGEPNSLIHYNVSALIGAGGVNYDYIDNASWPYNDNFGDASACFVFEPSAGAELNVTQFFRIDAGASYRLVRGTDLVGISDSQLSDFAVNLTFKFGKF
ncbi:MAG: hypothetical protein M1339_07730 [Bacteroidetes bacterium]|nr:hypothetical protein [Bacteroidota bacterium]